MRTCRFVFALSLLPAGTSAQPVIDSPPAAPEIRFVRWRQAQGLFSADVPAGWRVEGRISPEGLDKGAFIIEGFSPDGRAMFAFAHNWQYFMEYQYGAYRPGRLTVESLVLPQVPNAWPVVRGIRVTYRSPNSQAMVTNPNTGLPLRLDAGTLGFLATTARGEVLAGTAMGETLYMPVPGSPGLWGLRIFSGGIAPATDQDQADIQKIQARLVASLELAPEFVQAWNQAHDRTTERMRQYSVEMDRVFSRYLASTRRSNSPRKDPMEGWAEMMRGGHYRRDERTGEEHWVGNNHEAWWKNDRGEIVGSNTGAPPANNQNWYPLR